MNEVKTALVTGAGSGIGQACALRILDEGGRVVSADVSERGLADTAAKAGDTGGRLTTVVIDVGDEGSVTAGVGEAVAAVVAMLGSPDASFISGTEVRIDGGAHM